MSSTKTILLLALAMLAFAGNSILSRLAFTTTAIDAASFVTIRIASGALVLALLVWWQGKEKAGSGSWLSALALFAYAALFSFAYLSLSAATGALLLFGAVQITMMGFGFWSGERFNWIQSAGFIVALLGLVALLMPGLNAPPIMGAALMIGAGIAWGIYSLRGRGSGDPTRVTAGNFLLALPFGLMMSLLFLAEIRLDPVGVMLAVASGALASGVGYAIWYSVLPQLRATNAATVQLSVPVITAVGGVLLLGEAITLRLLLASMAILGGVAVVFRARTV